MVAIGVSPQGRVAFDLPGVVPPECIVEVRGRRRISMPTALDTVVVQLLGASCPSVDTAKGVAATAGSCIK